MSPTRRELVKWLKTKKIEGSVLDIGGHIWSMKEKVHPDSDISFYRTLGREDKANDVIDITREAIEGQYNHVFCTEVMQFLVKPLTAARNVRGALHPGGQAYFSFHFTHKEMKSNDYLRYTKKAINYILPKVGLDIDELLEPVEGYYLVQCHRR